MTRNTILWLAFGGAVIGALSGCNGTTNAPPQEIQHKVTLNNFDSCPALENYIEDNYVKQMQLAIDDEKNDRYGYYYPGIGFEGDAAVPAAGGSKNGGSTQSAPTAYTQTNTQVKGVDEADFMKNDGKRIFTLTGNTLFAATSWPPQDLKSAGKLTIEGWPQSMFLDENNRVTVFSSVWLTDEGAPLTDANGDYCYYCSSGVSATKVTVVDVSDAANLKVSSELYFPGYLNDARRIGSSVRIVIGDWFNWPAGITYWPEYDANDPNKYNDKAVRNAALDAIAVKNEAIIRGKTLDFWLKKGKRKTADGTLVDVGYNCSDFTYMNAPTKMTGLLNVITVNLDKLDDTGSRVTLLGEMGTIYASAKALYVAEWHWWWWWWMPGQSSAAYIHKFDITDPDKAVYKASGVIDGHIVDQFSMDELDDNLRVAHTIETWQQSDPSKDQWAGWWDITNRVSVLGEKNGELNVIGQTDDIAKGERIQSSRFVGTKGFVVTYLQVDPLFSVDLKDPKAPKVVGELKVPGFSTYIHPLDENHLLTIGVYTPDPSSANTGWTERRQQLAIFDVSDFANPVQTFTITSGTAYGWSEANWDHHAFNYFPERGLLAIPFSDYKATSCAAGTSTDTATCWNDYWGSFVSEIRVFKVDTKTGFEYKGAVSLADVYVKYGDADWEYYYSPWVRRSVMATDADGKDFVYAVSDAGIRAANLGTLETLATAEFGPTYTGP